MTVPWVGPNVTACVVSVTIPWVGFNVTDMRSVSGSPAARASCPGRAQGLGDGATHAVTVGVVLALAVSAWFPASRRQVWSQGCGRTAQPVPVTQKRVHCLRFCPLLWVTSRRIRRKSKQLGDSINHP